MKIELSNKTMPELISLAESQEDASLFWLIAGYTTGKFVEDGERRRELLQAGYNWDREAAMDLLRRTCGEIRRARKNS